MKMKRRRRREMTKKELDSARVKRVVRDHWGTEVVVTEYDRARIISGGQDDVGLELISLVGVKYRGIADALLLKTSVLLQYDWIDWDAQYEVMRRVYAQAGKPMRYVREIWYVKYDR
jgi:hypothetical protein